MAITIDREAIKRNVARLKNTPTPQRERILKDLTIGDVQVKNVPYIKDEYSYEDAYLISGKTLDRVYNLVLENERKNIKQHIIEYQYN